MPGFGTVLTCAFNLVLLLIQVVLEYGEQHMAAIAHRLSSVLVLL